MSASNAIMMEQTFKFLKPTIWVTAIPRILYLSINVVPVFLPPPLKKEWFLPSRWAGLSYYVSFIILPIVVALNHEDIKRKVIAIYISGCHSQSNQVEEMEINETSHHVAVGSNQTIPGRHSVTVAPDVTIDIYVHKKSCSDRRKNSTDNGQPSKALATKGYINEGIDGEVGVSKCSHSNF